MDYAGDSVGQTSARHREWNAADQPCNLPPTFLRGRRAEFLRESPARPEAGKATIVRAEIGRPPMAYTSLNELAAANLAELRRVVHGSA